MVDFTRTRSASSSAGVKVKHVGVDDHARTLSVGIAEEGVEARYFGQIEHKPEAVRRLLSKLASDGSTLVVWQEAGPCGYGLYRHVRQLGHRAHVVAPSLTPRRVGGRVKTDRRDSLTLAKLGRAGELTPVWVPDAGHEAIRDLVRSREDAVHAQRRARQQLNAFLLRHGRRYEQGQKWTVRFFRWLDRQRYDDAVAEMVFADYVQTVHAAADRITRIEQQMREVLAAWSLKPVIQSLLALRGVDVVTAMTVVGELGDLRRFESPRQLMAYLGLTPSENSSGPRTRRGGITKTGNARVRRVLIEAAWCYRHPARQSEHLQRKAKEAPPVAREIAWKAQRRLCKRYRALGGRGKLQTVVCTAIAREMCGFIWAICNAVWPTEASGSSGDPSLAL